MLRKCNVTVQELKPYPDDERMLREVPVEKEGLFHQFGPSLYIDSDGGEFAVTSAFVELKDGRVISVDPERVRFLSQPE